MIPNKKFKWKTRNIGDFHIVFWMIWNKTLLIEANQLPGTISLEKNIYVMITFTQKIYHFCRRRWFQGLKIPSTSASGTETVFFPQKANELCIRLRLILNIKQGGKDSQPLDDNTVAKSDKLLEYECNTSTQVENYKIYFG